MEREHFIFYRSFYEAIICMSDKVQLQVFNAIAEYALDGKEPSNLCKEAQGMFLLIRPAIDSNNARAKNGKKGAKYGNLGGRPRKNPVSNENLPTETYKASFREESEQMKKDETWLDSVCMQYHIDKEELKNRLDAFPLHCETECSDKPHSSLGDAKKHFCAWMRKAYPHQNSNQEDISELPPPDYAYNGFGSIDV